MGSDLMTQSKRQKLPGQFKSKLPKQYKPEAYNQRDVVGLPAFTEWTLKEEAVQREHNRI
jgi:hypothetical protein